VADIAISIGAGLLILDMVQQARQRRREANG
jgi:lipoprotein signal peptidase